jgi:hypothetical protein
LPLGWDIKGLSAPKNFRTFHTDKNKTRRPVSRREKGLKALLSGLLHALHCFVFISNIIKMTKLSKCHFWSLKKLIF